MDASATTTGDVFDASQYAFFGEDVVEEVELGGLDDDDEEEMDLPHATTTVDDVDDEEEEEEEFLFDKQEAGLLRSQSNFDHLTTTFSKLNKIDGEPKAAGIIGDGRSRENSSNNEWVHDIPSWLNQQILDSESVSDGKQWPSLPFSSDGLMESMSFHRTSSQLGNQLQPPPQLPPQQQHQLLYGSEPIIVPKSSHASHRPAGRSLQASPNNHTNYLNVPYAAGGPHIGLSPHNLSPLSTSPIQMSALHQNSNYSENLHQFSPGLPFNNQPPNHLINHTSFYPGGMNNMLQRQLPHQNGLIPPQFVPHQQHNRPQPSYGGQISGMQPQPFNSRFSLSAPLMSKVEAMLGMGDCNQRPRSAHQSRQNLRDPLFRNGWPQRRSKYMSAEEIDGILRMQLAATHSNDPYVDDYYHQACLARKSAGAKLKHHFCPVHLRDLHSRANANNEPHAFLQVEALGRVPFSSIRRPRPLLEVDPPNSSSTANTEQNLLDKPLEQEPMLAARVIIEDGLCLLLDVDDIDRFLEFNQMQDCVTQLRQKRMNLLEELATSLHLVDPLGNNCRSVAGIAHQDDLVFLRILSLPKGRKLLAKYLQLLFPCPELMRVVCMAIFRHLRFLFGVPPSDPKLAELTVNLARVVSSCVHRMDLGSLSACLAAVVCSNEKPPLRPLGSPDGNGASVVLKSVLDSATKLLTDPHTASNYNITNRSLWQCSFDEFFGLLTNHCINKYDSITQALLMESPLTVNGPEALKAIGREMPVELLHSSLPHTNEHQRRRLQDFVARSMPVAGYNAHDGAVEVN
ncbi:hypothetical protein ACFE04_024947 [Oxalis oulophora]